MLLMLFQCSESFAFCL